MPTSDSETITDGIRASYLIFDLVLAILDEHPRGYHVAMVALLHSAVRAEVNSRVVGVPREVYHKRFHDILDDVLAHEERRKEAGL